MQKIVERRNERNKEDNDKKKRKRSSQTNPESFKILREEGRDLKE